MRSALILLTAGLAGSSVLGATPAQAGPLRSPGIVSYHWQGWWSEPVTSSSGMQIPADVLFGFDSADLQPGADTILTGVAGMATLKTGPITITGYTDDTGSPSYNEGLSLRRAQAVEARLISLGVDPARLQAVGDGEADPVASNSTESGRAENRRVLIVFGD